MRDPIFAGADLSGAIGLLDPIEYMQNNFEKTNEGYIVYKIFDSSDKYQVHWNIEPKSIIQEVVNRDSNSMRGGGITVFTKDYIRNNNMDEDNPMIWKCLIHWEWLIGVVVPYDTEGVIRCSRLELLEVVENTNA